MLNGVATVTTADIIASNGVVHVVDKVIGLPTIVTHAAKSQFHFFSWCFNRSRSTDFVTILSGTGPFTVFAPTNAAFTALRS
jgi:uncharacterized surface protein with fasciclin (FAS1) repeats